MKGHDAKKKKKYLKRKTVYAEPGGTGLVPSAASWCSPCDWHSESCLSAHPGNTSTIRNLHLKDT